MKIKSIKMNSRALSCHDKKRRVSQRQQRRMFSMIHVVCLERILWKEKHLPLLLSLILPFILNLNCFNHDHYQTHYVYCIYDVSCHSIKADDAEQEDLFLYIYILIQRFPSDCDCDKGAILCFQNPCVR